MESMINTKRVLSQDTIREPANFSLEESSKRGILPAMETSGDRIKQRREELGWSQDELAYRCGWPRTKKTRISNYENNRRAPSREIIEIIAKAMGVTPGWIDYDQKPKYSNENTNLICEVEKEIPTRNIPLLTEEEALQWCLIPQQIKLSNHTKKITVPLDEFLSPYCYAIRVPDDSMNSPSGLSFSKGQIIRIDPEKKPLNGSFVVAIVKQPKQIIFKQYIIDAGKEFLKSLHPQYRLIELSENIKICGVVISFESNIEVSEKS
jgi:SOS-response transcriptional repressor LexA